MHQHTGKRKVEEIDSDRPSEQALSELEQSTAGLNQLIDAAARILKLEWHNDTWKSVKQNVSDNSATNGAFREQWILRWLIKSLRKVVEEVRTEHSTPSFHNVKVWALLHYVLLTISPGSSQDILLGRAYYAELGVWVILVLDEIARTDARPNGRSSAELSDHETGRVVKRRRLSASPAGQTKSSSHEGLQLLLDTVLCVARTSADIIPQSSEPGSGRTQSVPLWTANIEQAARTHGSIMRLAHEVLAAQSTNSDSTKRATVSATLQRWNDMWTSRTGGVATAKQELNTMYNAHCVAYALQLLGDFGELLTDTVKQDLEKQVALRFILPAREYFNKKHAGIWRNSSKTLTWSDIRPIYEDLCERLSTGLKAMQQHSGEELSATLLSVATRLIPRSDLVRQRSEAAWYEALFVSLCCIQNSDLVSSAQVDSDDMDISVATTLELGSHAGHALPLSLIHILAATGVEPSVRSCRFVLETIILASKSRLSMDSLLSFLKLNPRAFVSNLDSPDSLSLLKLLDTKLKNAPLDNASDRKILLQQVVPLIIHEFGQSRQLDNFVEFWIDRLERIFADNHYAIQNSKTRADTSDSRFGSFWSDMDVFQVFKQTCRTQRPDTLAKKVCARVKELMTTIADHIGPVHHISARVAVLSALLETQAALDTFRAVSEADATELCDLLQKALELGNDYQGQRWRYWKLLNTLTRLCSRVQVTENVQRLAVTTFTETMIHSAGSPRRGRAELLQSYQCFTLAVSEANSSTSVLNTAVLGGMVNHLASRLAVLQPAQESGDTTIPLHGGIEDVQCLGDLVLACILRLCDRTDLFVLPQDSITTLASGICKAQLNGHYQGQGRYMNTMEAFFSSQIGTSDVRLLDIYLKVMADMDVSTRSIQFPSYIFEQAEHNISKSQSQGLVKIILQDMKRDTEPLTQERFAEYLALLAVLVVRRPSLGSDGEITQILLHELKRRKLDLNLDTIMVMDNALTSIIEAQLKLGNTSDKSSASNLVRLALKLASKKVESKKHDVADAFGGLAVIACLAHLKLFVSNAMDSDLVAEVSDVQTAWQKRLQGDILHVLQQDPSLLVMWKLSKMLNLRRSCSVSDSSEDHSTDQVRLQIEEASFTRKFLPECIRSHDIKKIAHLFPLLVEGIAHLGQIDLWPTVSFLDDLCRASEPDARLASIRTRMMTKIADACMTGNDTVSLATRLESKSKSMLADQSDSDRTGVLAAHMYQAYTIQQTKEEAVDAAWIFHNQRLAMLDTLDIKSATQLICTLDTANLILSTHTSIVNQHVVETILYSLTTLTCQRCAITTDTTPGSTSPQPEHIYLYVLRLLSTILTQHRRRLRGRTHLILPLLQNLLKCLFLPSNLKQLNPTAQTTKSKTTFLSTMPYWLYSRKSSSNSALPPNCARKFSRILQTLCDPPASAARALTTNRSSKHQPNSNSNANTTPTSNLHLTDLTRQLKRHISQHTQYLLQTFCQASLDGYLAPSSRDRLLPGLYSVIDATEIEVLRGMNAAMSDAQRSIWKDLYAEWKRFGKWNGR